LERGRVGEERGFVGFGIQGAKGKKTLVRRNEGLLGWGEEGGKREKKKTVVRCLTGCRNLWKACRKRFVRT
jgi:hypothetical protein